MQPAPLSHASLFISLLAALLLTPLAGVQAQVNGQKFSAEGNDPTAIGQVEHTGYALIGSRGRHYLFGGIAMADYADSAGTRRMITLQHEDQIRDERHVYYRELRAGHRWAFSRNRGSDGQFGVWFQLAPTDPARKPKWQLFHRARLEEPKERARPVPTRFAEPAAETIAAAPAPRESAARSADRFCSGVPDR